jgi:hypothetical protein
MDSPKYVIKTHETVSMPTGNNQPFATLRIVVWVIIAVIILGSFVFGDNLFSELSWTARMILIALAIGISFWGPKSESVASPLEIRFYSDYLVVFREKRYYSRKVSRKEYNKFFYSDISKIEYDYRIKRLDFIGKIDAMWFNYNKDGSVPQNPSYHRVVDGGICYFYVNGNDTDTILKCLEEYTAKQPIVQHKTEVSQ